MPTTGAAPRRRRRLLLLLAAVAGTLYVADQVTKVLAVAYLVEGQPVPLVPGVLDLYLLYNPGAAFSLATGLTWLLTVVAVGVVVAIVLVARRVGSRGWATALGLLLGGAVGNLTDRLVRQPGFAEGHVVDFLRLPRWPVFNLADSAIVAGALLVVLLTVRGVGVDGTREKGGEAGGAQDGDPAGAQDGDPADDQDGEDAGGGATGAGEGQQGDARG
ncbi:signal peptidase II [Pseudokineococcus sp. 1T1Z-3]|uniref:signal peptidase II n=1 Tax=Pseudokineococcus sp. 1T1Z-3 TaxID=3132745 RepID=UPI0030A844FE